MASCQCASAGAEQMKMPFPQRGVALIIALLVVALATILIASLLDRGELALARTRNQMRLAQAQTYMEGLEAYAAHVLIQSAAQGNNSDSNSSPWAIPLPSTPVPEGRISATMRDLNGCFNLNNLIGSNGAADPAWTLRFTYLLKALKIDPGLTQVAVDWMLASPIGSAANGDGFYLAQSISYRTARQYFHHASELRLLRGVDGDTYAKLAPNVCALPQGTLINVNTATVPVLMTLFEGMTEQQAQRLWQNGHANFSEATASTLGVPTVDPNAFGVRSDYFLARGDIRLDELPFTFYSLIQFGGTGGGIRVISRTRGGDE
jgi:general secretion pathway protein K